MSITKYFSYTFATFKSVQIYLLDNCIKITSSKIIIIAMRQIWFSIYHSGYSGGETSVNYNQMITYATVSGLLARVYIFPTAYEISERVANGDIVFDLMRPINISILCFFRTLGYMVHNILYMVIPSIFVIIAFFPITLPSVGKLSLFLFSVSLALILSLFIEMVLCGVALAF